MRRSIFSASGGTRRFSWFRVAALGWALTTLGCRTDGAVQAALHGDLKTLQAEIKEAQNAGRFDKASIEELARAVAGREVRSAKGQPAVERLRSVRACAAPLYPVLEDRSTHADDAGAEAALILLEMNRIAPGEAIRRHAESASGSWRAVAARASFAAPYALKRRQYFRDPDERVRRAALSAALIAKDPGDLPELLEAARLDPDDLSRSLATRTVGAIGGRDAVLRLTDRWTRASSEVRAVILEAWAMPASFKAGGEQQLLRVAETETGELAIAAAHALYQSDSEHEELGAQILARAAAEGTRSERQFALRLASVEHTELLSAIEKASKDEDPYVRVMAHAKLVVVPKHRHTSLGELRKLAKLKGNEGVQARAALAAAGDASIAAALKLQLVDKSTEHRKLAARGLLRLGMYPEVATALGDESPDVRTAVACNVLSFAN